MADLKCFISILSAPSLAAISAASLHTLAISAPVKPCVSAASCLASSGISREVVRGARWT